VWLDDASEDGILFVFQAMVRLTVCLHLLRLLHRRSIVLELVGEGFWGCLDYRYFPFSLFLNVANYVSLMSFFKIEDCAEGYLESSVVTTVRIYHIALVTRAEDHLDVIGAFVDNCAAPLEKR